ncbi:M42 family metallopeptidase [Chloroflexota bacterium]
MKRSTRLGKKKLQIIEKLSNAMSISGDESEVRNIILDEIGSHISDHTIDSMGNLLVEIKGTGRSQLKVMLAAHMDEIGFMITASDGDGIFRFEPIGGIDLRQLPGKAVIVGKDHHPGVIGARPIHLTTAAERKEKIPITSLRIDLGPGMKTVKPGDSATFNTNFRQIGQSLVGKALDDRLGVAVLIEIIKDPPTNMDLKVAFTVQEETGLRGARIAAFSFDPDLAFIIDSTPANDLPTWDGEENHEYNCKLGEGPAVYTADGATLSDPRLVRHSIETAKRNNIHYQNRQPGGGGTDAGSIHKQRSGIPSVSISIPSRYAHTAAGVARVSDYLNTIALMKATLESLPRNILKQERR